MRQLVLSFFVAIMSFGLISCSQCSQPPTQDAPPAAVEAAPPPANEEGAAVDAVSMDTGVESGMPAEEELPPMEEVPDEATEGGGAQGK